MLKEAAAASLVAIFSLSSVDIVSPLPGGKDYTFEVTEETDFGQYTENSTNNVFELPLTIGNAYNHYTFACEAFIYFPNPDGTYDWYPDNGDMVSESLDVYIPSGNSVGYFTATFRTSFFGWATYCKSCTDIILVFQLDGTPNTVGSESDASYSFTFSSRVIQMGYGEYTIESGVKEFYPYDDHIVFGGERPNDNITEMIDLSDTTNAICEEKYLDLNEKFKVSLVTNIADQEKPWDYTNDLRYSIYVKDPKFYFPDMHEKKDANFQVSLKSDYVVCGVGDTWNTFSATFKVGGSDYWVNPSTLEMSKTEKPHYKKTQQFFFRVGYFEKIKENCEFYLRVEGLGHNKATYNIKLDFLGDHNYFGSCTDSDYCMHYGRG